MSPIGPLATLRAAQRYVGNWGLNGQRADIAKMQRMTQLGHVRMHTVREDQRRSGPEANLSLRSKLLRLRFSAETVSSGVS